MGAVNTRDAVASLDQLLRDGGLHCVYQPFVDVDSGAVVAFEALLRGPEDSELHSTMALLETAR